MVQSSPAPAHSTVCVNGNMHEKRSGMAVSENVRYKISTHAFPVTTAPPACGCTVSI